MLQRPYLVQGGFRSWVEEGLRVKELKPETALTILNEVSDMFLNFLKVCRVNPMIAEDPNLPVTVPKVKDVFI